jgi:hypothetical protein
MRQIGQVPAAVLARWSTRAGWSACRAAVRTSAGAYVDGLHHAPGERPGAAGAAALVAVLER